MSINRVRLRQLHRALVPFMVLPLLLTLTTGMLFQFAVAGDRASDFIWLLDLHKGKFGPLNLEMVYPILNALGLLTLVITGSLMWWQSPRRKPQKLNQKLSQCHSAAQCGSDRREFEPSLHLADRQCRRGCSAGECKAPGQLQTLAEQPLERRAD